MSQYPVMKYLFYISKKYSIPIIKPLIDYLDKQGEEYALFISEKVKRTLGPEWQGIAQFTEIQQAIDYNPDFALAPGNFIDFRIPGIKVQLFHGLGVEKESHYRIRHFFDVYLTSGPVVTQRFNKLQEKYQSFLVKETGWAKVDYILSHNLQDIRNELQIPQDKKIILYAPTFSRRMESASDLLHEIPRIARANEVWLLKFHELMNKETIEKIESCENKNIRIVETHDITSLLHAADCLVSDTSSVLYEFMLLGKPVVTYRTQGRPEKGIDISEPKQLRTAIDKSLEIGLTIENRKCLEEVNPYLDGRVSANIFRTLDDIKKNNLLIGKKKRLNLFRKMQVLYHERFRKGYLR